MYKKMMGKIGHPGDSELIAASLGGDREALEELIRRHQGWIYNIAFRMVLVPQDAEDVTQEILIKMMTKLSTYDAGKASFRTWLYTIVANHVTNMKKRGYERDLFQFRDYYTSIGGVPDESPQSIPDAELLIQDIMIGCVLGTMLCLERRERLAFILGVVFDVPDAVGGEVLGITAVNFRKILSRARKRLFDYMHGNCGVLNENNACRCRKKAKGFMDRGWHTPDRITFVDVRAPSVQSALDESNPDLRRRARSFAKRFDQQIYSKYVRLFREHPFYTSPDLTSWLRKTLESTDLDQMFRSGN
ncbi:MAG: RNA polymerase sigma factor [Acidobacteriota bacterium]